MLELLDRIDKATALTPVKAEELLHVKLNLVPGESSQAMAIFRGHGELWKEAELRLPRPGSGSAFVLVLKLAKPLPMTEVLDRFGDKYAMDQPNPAAGEQASFGYIYRRSNGILRFSFPSFQDYAASIILVDRMPSTM